MMHLCIICIMHYIEMQNKSVFSRFRVKLHSNPHSQNYITLIYISMSCSLPEATIATMIEVDVLVLSTRTVAKTPIIKPAIGFLSSLESYKAEPKNITTV